LKTELDKKKAKIESLKASIAQEQKNKMFEFEQQKLRKLKMIEEQRETMSLKSKENTDKLEQLEEQTKESIEGYDKMLQQMKEKHGSDMERLVADQNEKIEADHAR